MVPKEEAPGVGFPVSLPRYGTEWSLPRCGIEWEGRVGRLQIVPNDKNKQTNKQTLLLNEE
jgi:hypothetical protein